MTDPSDFHRLLRLLGREGQNIRVCRAKDGAQFAASSIAYKGLSEHLAALESAQFNVWFELNPSSYALPAGRSNAGDITALSALYADLDFKEAPQGLGSLDACMEVIEDLSAALGTQPAAIVHSGGGLQPYWPISDGQITDNDSRRRMMLLLRRWGAFVKQFAQAARGDADNVFDLARILRVPGSVNHKQNGNPRPTAVDFFGTAPMTVAEIEAILDDYDVPVGEYEIEASGIVSPLSTWDWAESDCQFVAVARNEIATSQPNSRHHWALKWAALLYGMVRSGCLTEESFYELRTVLVDRFKLLLTVEGNQRGYSAREMTSILKAGQMKAESWSQTKLGTEMRSHLHDNSEMFTPPEGPPLEPVEIQQTTIEHVQLPVVTAQESNVSSIFTKMRVDTTTATSGALALDLNLASQQRIITASHTEMGNSERFGQWVRGRYIHVAGMGWQEWRDGRWAADTDNRVQEAVKDMLMQGLLTAPDDATRAWMKASMSRNRIKATLDLSTSLPSVGVPAFALDNKPFELNTPKGILDLAAGTFRDSDPLMDFHTKRTMTGAHEMEIPQFLAFLRWAMSETAMEAAQVGSRTKYLQRLFGLAMIGKLLHHVFPTFLGGGANGKSALLSMWGQLLGDYSLVLPPKFFVQKNGSEHPTTLASLRGIRMATASEVPPGARFDEDLVKVVTGEPSWRARFMHKDEITIPNTCTFFLAANHAPTVAAGGEGFWRRFRKIDFLSHVAINQQDPTLAERIIAEEGPGILWWGMEGARDVLLRGLRDPESVIASTRDYRLEEDMIASFLETELREEEGLQVSRAHVYEVYERWMHRQNMRPLSFVKFCREIVMLAPKANLGEKSMFTHMSMNVMTFEEE